MRLELSIPFDEPNFLADSVDFANANWHERYFAVKSRVTLHVADNNPYEPNNLWMLESAAGFRGDRIAFIDLSNGQLGDGPGGAQHFVEQARRKTARIYWLDTTKLWD
jgi:hypothetical protein